MVAVKSPAIDETLASVKVARVAVRDVPRMAVRLLPVAINGLRPMRTVPVAVAAPPPAPVMAMGMYFQPPVRQVWPPVTLKAPGVAPAVMGAGGGVASPPGSSAGEKGGVRPGCG